MKALMFQGPNKAEVVEAERPEIGPDEILVASRAVGVCHSDFDLLSGKYIIPISFPTIPGHEWSGEVTEVGREAALARFVIHREPRRRILVRRIGPDQIRERVAADDDVVDRIERRDERVDRVLVERKDA